MTIGEIVAIVTSTLTLGGLTIGSAWLMHRENAKEMKDFHGRLCTLEQKYISMMEKYWESKK